VPHCSNHSGAIFPARLDLFSGLPAHILHESIKCAASSALPPCHKFGLTLRAAHAGRQAALPAAAAPSSQQSRCPPMTTRRSRGSGPRMLRPHPSSSSRGARESPQPSYSIGGAWGQGLQTWVLRSVRAGCTRGGLGAAAAGRLVLAGWSLLLGDPRLAAPHGCVVGQRSCYEKPPWPSPRGRPCAQGWAGN
jgi:hypothetical protein